MVRRFAWVSFGVLCLSLSALISLHIGSQSVRAQAPEVITVYKVVSCGGDIVHFVMLSNGDVYRHHHTWPETSFDDTAPSFMGNFWDGVVPTQTDTWGTIKNKYDANK